MDIALDVLKKKKKERNREKNKEGSTVKMTELYTGYDPEHEGNKVSVIGNPSLSDVRVVMIGVRNNEIVYVPLSEAIRSDKPFDRKLIKVLDELSI